VAQNKELREELLHEQRKRDDLQHRIDGLCMDNAQLRAELTRLNGLAQHLVREPEMTAAKALIRQSEELAAAREKNEFYRQLLDVRDKQLAAARGEITTLRDMASSVQIGGESYQFHFLAVAEDERDDAIARAERAEDDNAALRRRLKAAEEEIAQLTKQLNTALDDHAF
jgi:chromosome segregation ATPase